MIPGYCFYVCDWDGAGKGQMIYDTYLFLRLKFFFLFWKDGRKGVGGRVNLVYSVSFLLRHNSIFYHFGDKVFFFFFFEVLLGLMLGRRGERRLEDDDVSRFYFLQDGGKRLNGGG